jgi:hypothetical protein
MYSAKEHTGIKVDGIHNQRFESGHGGGHGNFNKYRDKNR